MNPTLNNNDIILINRFLYAGTNDIIAFKYNKELVVKRVVACNGEYIDKKYNLNDNFSSYTSLDKYFVLGDNLNESIDSRHFGEIEKSQILGVVIFHCNIVIFLVFFITIVLLVLKLLL